MAGRNGAINCGRLLDAAGRDGTSVDGPAPAERLAPYVHDRAQNRADQGVRLIQPWQDLLEQPIATAYTEDLPLGWGQCPNRHSARYRFDSRPGRYTSPPCPHPDRL